MKTLCKAFLVVFLVGASVGSSLGGLAVDWAGGHPTFGFAAIAAVSGVVVVPSVRARWARPAQS